MVSLWGGSERYIVEQLPRREKKICTHNYVQIFFVVLIIKYELTVKLFLNTIDLTNN